MEALATEKETDPPAEAESPQRKHITALVEETPESSHEEVAATEKATDLPAETETHHANQVTEENPEGGVR